MLYTRLPNGLTAIVKQEPNLKNAVVNIFINCGSSAEDKNKTGMAHFLEHMMFEGSKNYPDFDLRLQNLLAENNAFTSQDYTNYYELIPNKHIDKILEIERDRLESLLWSPKKFKLQQSIILEEFKETSINPPLADSWHYLLKLCFKNSYQWPVIGSKLSHIEDFKLNEVKKFYHQNYSPANIIISIISDLPEKTTLTLIEKNFKSFNRVSVPMDLSSKDEKKRNNHKLVKRKNISSNHLYIAYHIEDFGSNAYFLSDLVSDLLTNGDSSILYQNLIVKNKLCTEILSYTTDNLKCNLLIIEGKMLPGVDHQEVMSQIQTEINRLKESGITSDRFETIKNKSLTHWMFQLYNTTQIAHYLCLFNAVQIENPREWIQNFYSQVKKSQLESQIIELLKEENRNTLFYLKS